MLRSTRDSSVLSTIVEIFFRCGRFRRDSGVSVGEGRSRRLPFSGLAPLPLIPI